MTDQQRPNLPSDKDYLHALAKKIPEREPLDIKFEYLTKLLAKLGISDNPYAYVNLDGNDRLAVDQIMSQSFTAIQQADPDPELMQSLHQFWDYLAEEDELIKADLIFVFGGIELTRMEEGVRLLKLGYAEQVLFSGKHASYMKGSDITEAELYAKEAKQLGVHEDQLLLETQAINTPENVLYSVDLLSRLNWKPEKVIIVTSPYHLRRAYLTCQVVTGWDPQLIRHGAPSANHSRDMYFKDERTWSLAFLEYLKIYGGRVMKHF